MLGKRSQICIAVRIAPLFAMCCPGQLRARCIPPTPSVRDSSRFTSVGSAETIWSSGPFRCRRGRSGVH